MYKFKNYIVLPVFCNFNIWSKITQNKNKYYISIGNCAEKHLFIPIEYWEIGILTNYLQYWFTSFTFTSFCAKINWCICKQEIHLFTPIATSRVFFRACQKDPRSCDSYLPCLHLTSEFTPGLLTNQISIYKWHIYHC